MVVMKMLSAGFSCMATDNHRNVSSCSPGAIVHHISGFIDFNDFNGVHTHILRSILKRQGLETVDSFLKNTTTENQIHM